MLTPFPTASPLTKFAQEEYGHLPDLTVVGLDRGIEMVTHYHHVERHLGAILDKADEIESDGNCDALIIGCFGDPGLVAVRQVTSMPVLGTGEASFAAASMLGGKLGVVVPQTDLVYVTEKMIHTYQLSDRVVAVRSVEEDVPDAVVSKPEEFTEKMSDLCLRAIRDDDADVIIFGCIGFSWMVKQVREILNKNGFSTPVIEPGVTVYQAAKMVAELGLNQDRRKLAVTSSS
jgi:allantoin racemase|tara:strand:- start:5243 stop:5938 length:696 start_codon:yes stop_codon:yes gene_type:complete